MLVNLFFDISLLLIAIQRESGVSRFRDKGSVDFNYITPQKHVRSYKSLRPYTGVAVCRYILLQSWTIKHLNTYQTSADMHCLHHIPDDLCDCNITRTPQKMLWTSPFGKFISHTPAAYNSWIHLRNFFHWHTLWARITNAIAAVSMKSPATLHQQSVGRGSP